MVLQRLGYLDGACPIAVGLDHTHHLRLGLQERAEVVQVIDNGLTERQWDAVIDSAMLFSANVCKSIDNYVDEDFANSMSLSRQG